MLKLRELFFVICALMAELCLAEDRMYEDQVYYHSALDDVAFFLGEVEPDADMMLRRTLKSEPQTQWVVLTSPGGDMYGGMRAATFINNIGLNTFVPEGGFCASSCATMFLSGANRWVEGDVGVHQFYSTEDPTLLASLQKIEKQSQYYMGDLITVLNDFNLPHFVIPRMLENFDELHIFTEKEKQQLMFANTMNISIDKDCVEKIVSSWVDHIFENIDYKRPSCGVQEVIWHKKIETADKYVRKTDGQYNLSRCTGSHAHILSKGAISVSEFRRSYSGYNAVILDETGNELTFGNPRLYQTGSRNLITMQAKESMLINGKFEPIEIALLHDRASQEFSALLVTSNGKVTECKLS